MTNQPKEPASTHHLYNAAECIAIHYWTGDTFFNIDRARENLQLAFQNTLTKEQLDIVAPYPGDEK